MRLLLSLILLATTACRSHQEVPANPPVTSPLPSTFQTRIGPGCLTLSADHRVATTIAVPDAQAGYIGDSGRTWRVEWCSGMCAVDSRALRDARPTLLVYFWVDPAHPESVGHLSTVVGSFSKLEHPETCLCPHDEASADDHDDLTTACVRQSARVLIEPASGLAQQLAN